MAIVYSYPIAQIESSDLLTGTKTVEVGEPTKSFLVSDLVSLTATAVTASGVSGTFISIDDKEIIVTNGIITGINGL